MTSGQFRSIEIASISIRRDRRQRREPTHIEEQADSIRRLGLIHPIVIKRDHELVAGERRLLACKMLGWTHISAQYTDELDASQLLAIELEENVKRRDVPWQDQVRAVRDFHSLMSAQEGWTREKTADAIGLSRRQTSEMLTVADEIAKGDTRIAEAPKFSTASGIAQRKQERADEARLSQLKESFPGDAEGLSTIEKEESILRADFREWVQLHHAPRFNFIHCDFPYGIEADSFNQSSAPSFGSYKDSRAVWESLMDSLAIATKKICAPSAHLMFWFAMRKGDERLYEPTAKALERMGWDVNPMPLVWMKTDGSGIIPDPERGPRQIYETALFCAKGDRKIVRPKANAYGAPIDRSIHMSAKSEPMLKHFFEMIVDENTVMLDPTCGSGSAVRAAEALGARFALGLEINEEFASLASEALEKARKLRSATT